MARVTVEDCVDKVPNRFDLVLFAAHRARIMSLGNESHVVRDNDKNTVVALREFAESAVQPDDIREEIISSLQTKIAIEEDEAEMARAPAVPQTLPMDAMDEESILAALQSMENLPPDEVLRGDYTKEN